MLLFALACVPEQAQSMEPRLPAVDLPDTAHAACFNGPDRIIETPSDLSDWRAEGMVRYTEVQAPNGLVIAVIAQDEISDAQMLRSRNLIRFFLEDHPGSAWGEDKTAVANAMADNGAMLMMPNGAHREGNEPNLWGQPLYDSETPVVGHPWFMDNDFEHRDAAWEEIFHLVHDSGIGANQPGALPAYQELLLAEAEAALDDERWGMGAGRWVRSLRREGSLAQEYIVSVMDSYYGLWGPWTEGAGGMWGIYIAKTRDEVASLDPDGMALLEGFLPPVYTLQEPVHPDFEGELSLVFDEDLPYTHKTRYLAGVHLLGEGDVTVLGNEGDNTFVANAGDDVFEGNEGDDTVVYCGAAADFTLVREGEVVTVEGMGTDILVGIETVWFSDGPVVP
jgi:hypothetical protein